MLSLRCLQRSALIVAVLLLSACAGLGQRPVQRIATPLETERFELNARINLRVVDETFPGRVWWRHDASRDELAFSSPIGTSVARMRQDAQGAWLITANGERHDARDLRSLAADVLNWDLPIEALPYWVRGLAWPGTDAEVERDASGRVQLLRQAGWTISYLGWDAAGVAGLPSKLDVSGERMRIRLAIERWILDAFEGTQGAVAEQR